MPDGFPESPWDYEPQAHNPDECHHPDNTNCPCDCHSVEFDDRGAAFILGLAALDEAWRARRERVRAIKAAKMNGSAEPGAGAGEME